MIPDCHAPANRNKHPGADPAVVYSGRAVLGGGRRDSVGGQGGPTLVRKNGVVTCLLTLSGGEGIGLDAPPVHPVSDPMCRSTEGLAERYPATGLGVRGAFLPRQCERISTSRDTYRMGSKSGGSVPGDRAQGPGAGARGRGLGARGSGLGARGSGLGALGPGPGAGGSGPGARGRGTVT